jgi:hypothetical protein
VTCGSRPVAGRPRFFFGVTFIDFFMIFGVTQKQAEGKLGTSAPALTRATKDANPMTQADSVLSTPPTNTSAIDHPMMFPPRDPTRRRFLAMAAVASAVSASALAAATIAPNDVPHAVTVPIGPDPIYEVIKAHSKAYATMQAGFAEHRKAHELADAKVGPAHLDIPSMVNPGETVEAGYWWEIERAIPRAQYPDLYAHHNALLEERTEAHAAIVESTIGDEDEATEELCEPEFAALSAFAETIPTTLPGLMAMIVYAGECSENNAEAFTNRDCPLIENLAIAAKALIGRGA